MKRLGIMAGMLGSLITHPVAAEQPSRPPMPEWQTQSGRCTWRWQEADGVGLWTEVCRLGTGTWQIAWDRARRAFVERHNGRVTRIVVEAWTMDPDVGVRSLTAKLIASGHLPPAALCRWQSLAVRAAPRTTSFHALTPLDPNVLAPTATGDIPDPVCGPYGVSSHGLRYVITDLRWGARAIFVDEGQERPMFAPDRIVVRPRATPPGR